MSGRLHRRDDETRSQSYVDILARAGASTVVGAGRMARDEEAARTWAMYSHGAVFAETSNRYASGPCGVVTAIVAVCATVVLILAGLGLAAFAGTICMWLAGDTGTRASGQHSRGRRLLDAQQAARSVIGARRGELFCAGRRVAVWSGRSMNVSGA